MRLIFSFASCVAGVFTTSDPSSRRSLTVTVVLLKAAEMMDWKRTRSWPKPPDPASGRRLMAGSSNRMRQDPPANRSWMASFCAPSSMPRRSATNWR